MDDKIKKLFELVQKSDTESTVYLGDDLSMGSVAPYGISSGMAELDLYLGRRGGLPAGKVIEYFGMPASGKTTAALAAAAEWQKRGGLVIFIDTEQAFSPQRAREVGCIPENIIKHEDTTVEAIFQTFHRYLGVIDDEGKKKRKGLLDDFDAPVLFIVDSVTGVPTEADAKGDITDSDRPGYEAKQIKRGIRQINPVLSRFDCRPSAIFINHAIEKIGGWGKKSDSGGGNGLKFFSSVRVQFTAIGQTKDKDTKAREGHKTAIQVIKLKGGQLEFPSLTAELTNEIGFDRYESLKLAMIATDFARRPKGAQTMTVLPDTGYEVQFAQKDFRMWVEQQGGYDKTYKDWYRWCVKQNILSPWGGKFS